jgi:hypothetical protein
MPAIPFAFKSDPFLSLKTIYNRVKTQDMLNVVVSRGTFWGIFLKNAKFQNSRARLSSQLSTSSP